MFALAEHPLSHLCPLQENTPRVGPSKTPSNTRTLQGTLRFYFRGGSISFLQDYGLLYVIHGWSYTYIHTAAPTGLPGLFKKEEEEEEGEEKEEYKHMAVRGEMLEDPSGRGK